MIDHFTHYWLYGVFFLALTYVQVLWGAGVLRRAPTARVLRIGAYANLALVALWLATRTVGVPFGPEAGDPEPVGSMDIAAVIVELALVAYVGVIVRGAAAHAPRPARAARRAPHAHRHGAVLGVLLRGAARRRPHPLRAGAGVGVRRR